MDGKIDNKQFGGISGTSTTDVLLEMVNKWYESNDNLDSYVRVVMLDFSKAFDLINHCLLLEKNCSCMTCLNILSDGLRPFYWTEVKE